MMKLILKLRFEPEERLQERVFGSTRKFSELLHHYERIAKDERRLSTILEIREELLRYRLKELPDSEEEFIQLGGKVSERLDSLCLDGATPDVCMPLTSAKLVQFRNSSCFSTLLFRS